MKKSSFKTRELDNTIFRLNELSVAVAHYKIISRMSQKESFFSVHDGKPVDPMLFGYADIFHYGRRDSQQRLNKQQADRTTSDQSLSSHD